MDVHTGGKEDNGGPYGVKEELVKTGLESRDDWIDGNQGREGRRERRDGRM